MGDTPVDVYWSLGNVWELNIKSTFPSRMTLTNGRGLYLQLSMFKAIQPSTLGIWFRQRTFNYAQMPDLTEWLPPTLVLDQERSLWPTQLHLNKIQTQEALKHLSSKPLRFMSPALLSINHLFRSCNSVPVMKVEFGGWLLFNRSLYSNILLEDLTLLTSVGQYGTLNGITDMNGELKVTSVQNHILRTNGALCVGRGIDKIFPYILPTIDNRNIEMNTIK